MIYLWIFGDNVEDRLGRRNFLFFYLLFGLIAGFAHLYMNPDSSIPTVGASGAVAGVMGAYIVFYPRSRILTLIPIFIFLHFVEIPAYFFLGIWFVFQFLSGTIDLAARTATAYSPIAWWAHIGGFVSGLIVAILLYRKTRKNQRIIYS